MLFSWPLSNEVIHGIIEEYYFTLSPLRPFNPSWILTLLQKSAQTVLRGCEEPCGSPRVRTLSSSRAPPLLSRLSETSSADENMSDVDSVPCSPLTMPCSPPARIGSCLSTFITSRRVWTSAASSLNACGVFTLHRPDFDWESRAGTNSQ